MGWSGGCYIMDRVIVAMRKHVADPKAREAVYREVIAALRDSDWDTEDDVAAKDPAYTRAMKAENKSLGYED